jgi:hypothetical protein
MHEEDVDESEDVRGDEVQTVPSKFQIINGFSSSHEMKQISGKVMKDFGCF